MRSRITLTCLVLGGVYVSHLLLHTHTNNKHIPTVCSQLCQSASGLSFSSGQEGQPCLPPTPLTHFTLCLLPGLRSILNANRNVWLNWEEGPPLAPRPRSSAYPEDFTHARHGLRALAPPTELAEPPNTSLVFTSQMPRFPSKAPLQTLHGKFCAPPLSPGLS